MRRDFSARITQADLEHAITADRRNHPFSKEDREEVTEKGTEILVLNRAVGETCPPNRQATRSLASSRALRAGVSTRSGLVTRTFQLWTEYAPLPPTVTTEAATAIAESEATAHGTVNPNGLETHYYFQYGETTSYGSSTTEGNAGSGVSSRPEQATIANLEPGMAYHYRIVASSSAGTSYGSDHTFTTSSAPSLAIDNSNNRWVVVEGANHTLDVYMAGTVNREMEWSTADRWVRDNLFRTIPDHR